ncbi:MAG: SipW-dependent-type signal peptide-containing protein [Tissierellaceae bacterium]
MKKTRFLALVLVVVIMGMGAGYAWWTDASTVTGEINTGTMDVSVGFANIHKPPHTTGSIEQSEDEKLITFTAGNLYPTAYNNNDNKTFGKIHFSLENRGTIPVKLGDIEFELINPDSPLWDDLEASIHIHRGTVRLPNGTSLGNSESLTGTNPLRGKLKDLDTLLLGSGLSTVELLPGEAIWFGNEDPELASIRYWIDKDSTNETQGQDIGFTLKFNWKQFNE